MSRARMIFWSLAALALFYVTFQVPGSAGIYGTNLDDSYPLVLEDAARRGAIFGREIIYTHGPLGYLFQPAGLGGYDGQRMAYAILRSVFFAYICCALLARLAWPTRLLLLAWLLFHPPSPTVIYAGVAVRLLLPPPQSWLQRVDWWGLPIVCALGGMVKFTELVSGILVAGSVAAVLGWRGQWRTAFQPLATLLVATLAMWFIAGQPLDALPEYLVNSWEIAGGFEAMVIVPKPGVLTCGLAGAAVLGVGALLVIATSRRRMETALVLAPVMASAFLDWKHGFVRADNHVLNFFGPLGIYAAMLSVGLERRVWWHAALVAAAITAGAAGMKVAGFKLAEVTSLGAKFGFIAQTVETELAAKREAVREEAALPRIKEAVGRSTVDIFNYGQAYAFLNDLTLRPRPVFQSFAAYTPKLSRINYDHFQSHRRPSLILFRLEGTDRRWQWLDDGPLLLEFLTDWQPLVREKGVVLMEKSPAAPRGEWKEIASDGANWGETITVPPHAPDTLIALTIEECRRTPWGRAKRFLYQGANLRFNVSSSMNWASVFTIVPEMATDRILLSPCLISLDDMLSWRIGAGATPQTISFRLYPWEGHESEFARGFRYRLSLWTPAAAPDRAAVAASARSLLFPYLPGIPLSTHPPIESLLASGAEVGATRPPNHIELAVPSGVPGIGGMAYISRTGAGTADIMIRVTLRDSQGRVAVRGEVRPGGGALERVRLDVDFPPGSTADGSARFLIESLYLGASDRPQAPKILWGPIKWRDPSPAGAPVPVSPPPTTGAPRLR